MSRGIQRIRERYNVPAKQHQVVRVVNTSKYGVISSGKGGNYLGVHFPNSRTKQYHPYDLDYLVGDRWVSGLVLLERKNTWVDRINSHWNCRSHAVKHKV